MVARRSRPEPQNRHQCHVEPNFLSVSKIQKLHIPRPCSHLQPDRTAMDFIQFECQWSTRHQQKNRCERQCARNVEGHLYHQGVWRRRWFFHRCVLQEFGTIFKFCGTSFSRPKTIRLFLDRWQQYLWCGYRRCARKSIRQPKTKSTDLQNWMALVVEPR